jgi:hypothetical protein
VSRVRGAQATRCGHRLHLLHRFVFSESVRLTPRLTSGAPTTDFSGKDAATMGCRIRQRVARWAIFSLASARGLTGGPSSVNQASVAAAFDQAAIASVRSPSIS